MLRDSDRQRSAATPRATTRRSAIAVAAVLAAAVGGGLSATAETAEAFVRTCSGLAASGCGTEGYHSYQESRSSKTGGAAASICVALNRSNGASYVSGCGLDTTFYRRCTPNIPPIYNTAGVHWGSSNAWTVDGRDATESDANVCLV